MITVSVNGVTRQLPDGASVFHLVSELDLVGKRIAVEVNLDIIPRTAHATTVLKNGDRIEVVHAIGGG